MSDGKTFKVFHAVIPPVHTDILDDANRTLDCLIVFSTIANIALGHTHTFMQKPFIIKYYVVWWNKSKRLNCNDLLSVISQVLIQDGRIYHIIMKYSVLRSGTPHWKIR